MRKHGRDISLYYLYAEILKKSKYCKPRTYRKVAHKEYLAIAKAKKPAEERRLKAVQQQLG